MSVCWELGPGGARGLRVLGDSPCPAVPACVEGMAVVEIGPYCFADKPIKAGAYRTGSDTHEITGSFVEEVTLPDTVRVLHSAAFYNCRKLRRISLGAAGESSGSDLITNCPWSVGEGSPLPLCVPPGGAVDFAAIYSSFVPA